MADVQFEEEQQLQRYGQAEQKPLLVRLVLSTGVVSTDNAAKYVLIGIAALAILVSFFIFLSGGSSSLKATAGAGVINISGEPPRLMEPISTQ